MSEFDLDIRVEVIPDERLGQPVTILYTCRPEDCSLGTTCQGSCRTCPSDCITCLPGGKDAGPLCY